LEAEGGKVPDALFWNEEQIEAISKTRNTAVPHHVILIPFEEE